MNSVAAYIAAAALFYVCLLAVTFVVGLIGGYAKRRLGDTTPSLSARDVFILSAIILVVVALAQALAKGVCNLLIYLLTL